MSTNPYAQVTLTYLRRPSSSWKPGVVFVCALLISVPGTAGLGRIGNLPEFAMLPLLPFATLFLFLVVHIKDQFADSRAHLTPGFRRIHAAVATAIAIPCAVFLPALFAWYRGWHSIGFVAIVILLLGTILWMLLRMSRWLTWLILVGWFLLCLEPGRELVQQLVSGGFEPQAVAILVVGAAIALLGGMRLFRLNEDMPDYRWIKWDQMDGNAQVAGSRFDEDPFTQKLQDWVADRQMARLASHAQQASSLRSRVCRWQVAMVFGWSLWLSILGVVLYLQLLTMWLSIGMKESQMPAAVIAITSFTLTFMPICIPLTMCMRRLPMLGHEMLLPVGRNAYVRQVGAAAALSCLQLWGGMTIALVLWWRLIGPRPIPCMQLAGTLVISAAFQIGAFGLMAWTARYRSIWLRFLALMVLIPVATMVQASWASFPSDQLLYDALWIAGITAALGLLITLDAYRRWLVADFD